MRIALATAAALALAGCGGAAPKAPPRLVVDSTQLKGTVVLAHEDQPIPAGKSALWCAAARLAWDAIPRKASGGPLAASPPADQVVVALLNRAPFPAAALDPAAFLAMGGFTDQGVEDRIRQAMREKFDREPDMPSFTGAPWVALGYAFLRKELPFAHPFERDDAPLLFEGGSKRLACFRIPEHGSDERREEVRRQVAVVFARWADANTFEGAVSIPSKDGKDRVVLALVPRAATLRATWDSVAAKGPPGAPLSEKAAFRVPMADIRLSHRFRDLEGGTVDTERGQGRLDLFRQDVIFRMNEAGVKLEAESVMASVGAEVTRERPSRFVFDRPFLLALVQRDAKDPYLLLWVANDELLAPME